jgi:ribulose-phosphate 3-epimerase
MGIKAGVALNPHTPVAGLSEIIADIDLICVMSVNPGFGGQKFIENTYSKVQKIKQLILQKNSKAVIEIDGGVNMANARPLLDAGADVLVAGNFVFSSEHPSDTIQRLKSI